MSREHKRPGAVGTESDETLLGSRVTELIERGLERYTQGDMEGALSDWEHAMVLDPDCVRARNYADYVRNYLAPGPDSKGRVLASPAIELDVPFGVELVGAKTEMDLEPYEMMEMERGANGRPGGGRDRRSEPHQRFDTSEDTTAAFSRGGYRGESEKQTVKIQRETMESERETPWRPGAIDDGWAFDSAPTKAYGRDGSPSPSPTAAPSRPDSSGELASAIEDVTAGLMAIQESVPVQLAAAGKLRIPGDATDDLVRTQVGDSDPTLRRPLADYDAIDLGADFDRDMGEVAEPPSGAGAAAEAHEDGHVELEPPRAADENTAEVAAAAPAADVAVVDDDDELELDVVDSVPPPPVRPEDASEDHSAIRPSNRLVFGRERPPPAVQISFRDPDRARPRDIPGSSPDPLDNLDLDGLEDELAQPGPGELAPRPRAPTQDPSIPSAGITVDESLLQFDPPTAEHASQGRPRPEPSRADSESDSEAARPTQDLKRAREARQDVGLYDDIAGDILNELESGPSNETRDERTRRRVAALIDRAASENRDGDHARAVIALDLALQEDPESAVAQKVIHRHRDLLLDIYKNYFGNLAQIPALAVPMHELKLHEINHRAAFLLSRIDGVLSLEDILDICGMSRLEAFRHLARLMLQGILEIR